MKIDLKKQLTLSDLKKLFVSRDDGKCEYHPYRDWQRIVAVVAILLALVGSAHVYLYWRYTQETSPAAKAETKLIDWENLKQVVGEIEAQNEDFDLLLEIPSEVPTP